MNLKRGVFVVGVLVSPLVITGCGGSSSSSSPGPGSGPDPIPGVYTISTAGGTGGKDGGTGGDGNDVELYRKASTGDAEILASDSADASFSAETPGIDLGSHPLIVSVDTTVVVTESEPAAGISYLVADSEILRISDGNGILSDETPVTGISVASGTTLTFGLNYATYAQVTLVDDASNSGSITSDDIDTLGRGGLHFSFASYIGATGSTVSTAGTQDGQNGGYVSISADYHVYNHGVIDTSGADSAMSDGGTGGYVALGAEGVTQNTGDIDASGGDADNGFAGNGGYVDMRGVWGTLQNSGSLNSNGGNGQMGGNAAAVALSADTGNIHNSGDISSQGGISSLGDGGWGGNVTMSADGGQLITSGDILTTGGDTTYVASASDSDADGGAGGDVYFYTGDASISWTTLAGDLLVSGNIDTSGGNAEAMGGGNGGSGGQVYAEINGERESSEARLAFFGYTDITTRGGDANYGGDAGDVRIYSDQESSDVVGAVPSGNVTNQANIIAHGGSVTPTTPTNGGSGGNGGDFYLETEYNDGDSVSGLEVVVNNGDADLSGGDGLELASLSSGRSGRIWFQGYNGVTNSGNLTANGGDGEDHGAGSDGIYMNGPTVSNSGSLTANGGDADVAQAGSVGGPGGWIELDSPIEVASVTHTGTISHAGGAGESMGPDGAFVNDSTCVSGDC